MSRKSWAILFIGVILFPIIVSYTAFHFHRCSIQKKVKLFLAQTNDKDHFLLLKFSKSELKTKLKWEHTDEFEYKGEMYDVIQSFDSGDTVLYWVWCDNKETELKKQYYWLLSDMLFNNSQQKENSKKLMDFLKILFFQDILFKIIVSNEETKIFIKNSSDYFIYLSLSSPPPKKV